MTKKWILTAHQETGDPLGTGKALVHGKEDLDRRQAEAKKVGVKTSVREVK